MAMHSVRRRRGFGPTSDSPPFVGSACGGTCRVCGQPVIPGPAWMIAYVPGLGHVFCGYWRNEEVIKPPANRDERSTCKTCGRPIYVRHLTKEPWPTGPKRMRGCCWDCVERVLAGIPPTGGAA